jgi:hypothetical protein
MGTPPREIDSHPIGVTSRMCDPVGAAGRRDDQATPIPGEGLAKARTSVFVGPRHRGSRGDDGACPRTGGSGASRNGAVSLLDVVRVRFRNLVVKVGRAHRSGGVRAAVRVAARMIFRQLRRPLFYAFEYGFDRRNGVDTRGRRLVTGQVMARSEHQDVVAYEATSMPRLKRLLRSLPAIDPADFTFIDLGCGKGATLVVAALEGFRRIVGVELDSQLAEAARINARVVQERTSKPVEVVEGDASAYRLPLEPSVIYLFNPFGLDTMRSVADSVMASLVQCPRPLFVVYLNPLHRCVWDETGVLRPISSGRGWVIYAAVGATDGQSR